MDRPNADLLAECFPGVQLRPGTGDFDTLLSIDKARRVLGYDPAHSWRDTVDERIGAGAGAGTPNRS
jgi:UDP-glucose 4-epimerase